MGIEDHFYNYMIYQLAFGLIAPVIDGGVAKIQVRELLEMLCSNRSVCVCGFWPDCPCDRWWRG